jgi:DNA-binding CsgD family transcriptional regulator
LALELEAELIGTARLVLETRGIALERLAARSEAIGDDPSPAERLLLAHMAAETFPTTRPAEEAAALAERALAGDRLLREQGGESPILQYAIHALALADRLDVPIALLTRGLEDAQRRGVALGYVRILSVRADFYHRAGRLADCVADARLGLEVMEGEPSDVDARLLMVSLCHGLVDAGDATGAAEALREHGLAETATEDYFDNLLAFARARVRLALGDTEAAVAELLACGARQEAWGALNPAMIPWRSTAAPALVRLGRVEEACALAAEELERARAVGAPRALGMALRAVALLADRETQIALLEEAGELLADSPARLEHARVLADLGGALRRAGRRAEARERLEVALDMAHRCGAGELEQHARDELLAAGSRPRRIGLTGAESLTPSERRVAEMTAGGLSNRDVAQALFVTVKTVEMHLGRAYRKLGIRARGDLRAALAPDASERLPSR